MKKDSLCWSCINAVPGHGHGCSWSVAFVPVDGWTATEREIWQVGTSYNVTDCPKYHFDADPDEEKKWK